MSAVATRGCHLVLRVYWTGKNLPNSPKHLSFRILGGDTDRPGGPTGPCTLCDSTASARQNKVGWQGLRPMVFRIHRPTLLFLLLLLFALLAIWCWSRGDGYSRFAEVGRSSVVAGDKGSEFPASAADKTPSSAWSSRVSLLLPSTLLLLPALAFLAFGVTAPSSSRRQDSGGAARKTPAVVSFALFVLCVGSAALAFVGRPFLWSHGFYVLAPGLEALGWCGVLYGASVPLLWRSRATRASWLFAVCAGVYLCEIVTVGVVRPALAPNRYAEFAQEQAGVPRSRSVAATSSQQPRPLRFAVFGDTGHEPDHLRQTVRRAQRMIGDRPLSGILLLGDNLSGEVAPYSEVMQRCFTKPFARALRARVPFFAILGNHDTQVPAWAEGELRSPLLGMNGCRYYSETFGQDVLTIFFLCSEDFWDNPGQIAWFSRELAACRSMWRIVAFHRPLLGVRGDSAVDWATRGLMMRLMTRRNSVDIMLTGHNHVYSRRVVENGILFITMGCSSRVTHSLHPDPKRRVGWADRRCFGYVEVERNEIRFEAVDRRGEIIDNIVVHRENSPERLRVEETRDDLLPSGVVATEPRTDPILPTQSRRGSR